MIQSWDIEFTLSTFNTLYEFVISFKHDDIYKICILLSDKHTCMLNISFLACTKVEFGNLKVCIAVNGEKFQSQAVTLTSIWQCPLSNLSKIFSYTTCSNFMFLHWLLLELSCKNTHTNTHTHTHTHTHTLTHTNTDTHRLWPVLYSCKNATIIKIVV